MHVHNETRFLRGKELHPQSGYGYEKGNKF